MLWQVLLQVLCTPFENFTCMQQVALTLTHIALRLGESTLDRCVDQTRLVSLPTCFVVTLQSLRPHRQHVMCHLIVWLPQYGQAVSPRTVHLCFVEQRCTVDVCAFATDCKQVCAMHPGCDTFRPQSMGNYGAGCSGTSARAQTFYLLPSYPHCTQRT